MIIQSFRGAREIISGQFNETAIQLVEKMKTDIEMVKIEPLVLF